MTLVSVPVSIKVDGFEECEFEFTGPVDDAARICRGAARAFERETGKAVSSVAICVLAHGRPVGRAWDVARKCWHDDDPNDYPVAQ